MTPWERLDVFEQQHGEYHRLLNDYIDARYGPGLGDSPPSGKALRCDALLRDHSRLIAACVAFEAGRVYERRYLHLAEVL